MDHEPNRGILADKTVPLAGQAGHGAARIVTGAEGEIYHTGKHYEVGSFVRIK